MPTLNVELTIDDLLAVVAGLDNNEFAEFEVRFEQLYLSRFGNLDADAANIAAQHRLSSGRQARLRELLWKNREANLSPDEELELDKYLSEMDRTLEKTADDLLALAGQRQKLSPHPKK